MKPCRVRQRKTRREVISELLLQLNLDNQGIIAEDYNVNLFDIVDETLRNREYTYFNEGLNSKIYTSLG